MNQIHHPLPERPLGISDAEWAVRVDLAACYRLIALFGMSDLIYNHITARIPGDNWEVVEISLPEDLSRYLVEKGSIAVDGISLTVVDALPDRFTVSLIPTTLEVTNLGKAPLGTVVNLEVDVLGKYVVAMLERMKGVGDE